MPVVFEALEKKTKKIKRGRSKALAAYLTRPFGIHFATQNTDEEILLFLRRHPITNLGWILGSAILLLSPVFIFPLISSLGLFPFTLPGAYKLVFSLFWYLAAFAFIFVNFLLWYFNVNIVTDKRVVDIDFHYLLVQEETATKLTQIEDVTYKRTGFIATIFDFGDVFVQTAGTIPNIEFLKVPQPAKVTKTIVDLMGR